MSTENPNAVVNGQGVLLQDRTIGGVEYKAGMGPAERAQALARSVETGTYAAAHNGNGPPLGYQTRATEQRLTQGEKSTAAAGTVAGKAPPPSPKQVERQNAMPPQGAPSGRVAEFDAEMRAAGKQITPQPRDASGRFASVPADQVDARLIDALNKAFAALTPAEREANRALYNHELTEAYEGRRHGETSAAFAARKGGQSAGAAPAATGKATEWSTPDENGTTRTLTPAGEKMQADLLAEWKALPKSEQTPQTSDKYQIAMYETVANEHGVVHVKYFNAAHLHGYKLPDFLKGAHGGQHYPPSVIRDLANARISAISQTQLETFIRSQMMRDGWIKA